MIYGHEIDKVRLLAAYLKVTADLREIVEKNVPIVMDEYAEPYDRFFAYVTVTEALKATL